VVFQSIYFSSSSTKNSVSGTSGDYCQNDKIPSTVQPRLAMSHPLRLSLSYRWILSWKTVKKSARQKGKYGKQKQMFCISTAFVPHVRNALPSWP